VELAFLKERKSMNDDAFGAGEPPAGVSLTPLAQEHLDRTRPWVRLVSVVLFLSAGLTALGGLTIVIVSFAGGLATPSARQAFPAFGVLGAVLLSVLYVCVAFLYVPPGLFLHRYAKEIAALKLQGSPQALEQALGAQKSFWKFTGILAVVAFVATFFAAMLVGAMSRMR
jgi:hypothetical protein